ncbi:MAG: hypothetical protein KF859_06685 [Phycisphaeraceae bacterium]|nr:hypothetical protein [Phycisphaeraceae bacterium]
MNAGAANNLPDPMRKALLAELHPGEVLRWCSPAHGPGLARANSDHAKISLLAAALFSALLFSVSIKVGRLHLESLRLSGNDSFQLPVAVIAAFAVGVLTLVLTFAVSIRRWLIRRSLHKNLAYAISDQRLMTLIKNRRGSVSVCSLSPPPLPCIIKHTYLPGGISNIVIRTPGDSPRPLVVLFGVLNPRAAISALRHMPNRAHHGKSGAPLPI